MIAVTFRVPNARRQVQPRARWLSRRRLAGWSRSLSVCPTRGVRCSRGLGC